MIQPPVLNPRPSPVLALVGGVVATILLVALLQVAPAFGLPLVDVPGLVGAVFTADATAAFWLGHCVFFLVGVLVVPVVLSGAWPALPGADVGFGGALVKGGVAGLVAWLATGMLLPALEALNRVAGPGVEAGFFALRAGLAGPVVLLLAHLAYGVALAMTAAMGQAIHPIQTLGWQGYGVASTPAMARRP